MIKHVLVLMVILVIAGFGQASAQRSDSIAAVVDGRIITYTDVYDRMNLVVKSARMPNTKAFKERLLPQVLTGLITEEIKIQEAEKLGLKATQEEIDKGFEGLAKQNGLTLNQFKSLLERDRINPATMENQIRSQIEWGKVVQKEIRPRITLTDRDIQSEVDQLKARAGQSEYLVAEIVMPYGDDSNAKEADVRKAINDIHKQLSRDPRKFPLAARQFSQSATAANSGIIGWVMADQLDEDMALTISSLKVGTLSHPIKTDDSYKILFLKDKRTIKINGGQAEEKLRIKVANFTLPNDLSAQRAMESEIESFRRNVKGCLDIVKQVTKRKDAQLQEFYDAKSNIPVDIVAAVNDVAIGDVGTSLRSEKNIAVPMMCGRDGGQGDSVMAREIENRMGLQRMDSLQKRYLLDLISNAYIERRV